MDTINYINVNGTTYEISGNIDTSTLMKVATTLSNVPTVTTLSHNGTQFVVGDIVRVADQSSTTGYSFYRLHKIENNQALWAKLDTGTVDDSATITVSMNSNQNETFTSGSATISYTYNNATITDTQSGATAIFTDVPAGVSYTISFGTVNGYATPSNVTGTTATFGRPSHTVTYNTELVSVTTEMSGATLYVNGIEYTEPIKIAWGSTYTVTGSSISGYNVSSDTYTASQTSVTREVVYTEVVSGIFVMTADGHEVSVSQATSSCVGVVVRDADHNIAFFIDKRFSTGSAAATNVGNYKAWSNALYNTDQSYLTNINTATGDGNSIASAAPETTRTAAFAAYANGETGVVNTDNLVADSLASSENASNNAAKYCRSIANPVTGAYNGYLGSLAEWIVVNDNQVAINQAMSAIGGVQFAVNTSGNSSYTFWWTSSEFSSGYAWYWRCGSSSSYAYFYYSLKSTADQRYCARPFYPLS